MAVKDNIKGLAVTVDGIKLHEMQMQALQAVRGLEGEGMDELREKVAELATDAEREDKTMRDHQTHDNLILRTIREVKEARTGVAALAVMFEHSFLLADARQLAAVNEIIRELDEIVARLEEMAENNRTEEEKKREALNLR